MQATTRSHARFTLEACVEATQARLLPSRLALFESHPFVIATDSRELSQDCAFLPLVGERFDAHTFLDALPEGVPFAFCSETYAKQHPDVIETCRKQRHVLLVEDTLVAYQQLAKFHRSRIQATVIGLTGSSGKTTVKEYLLHALSGTSPTQATEQNFNNDIGVARTVLNIQEETRYAVVEMGMRGLGEIRRLVKFVQPDVGLIINAGVAHLECLGSVEAIAEAKSELAEGVKQTLITNSESPTLQARLAQIPETLAPLAHLHYSLEQAEGLGLNPEGKHTFTYKGIRFTAPLPGVHHASNLMAVITVAEVLGLNLTALSQRMEAFQPSLGRFEAVPLPNGHSLVNDAYNANPESMRASLDAFLQSPLPKGITQRVAILGSMKELGASSPQYHQALMSYITELQNEALQHVIFIGAEFTQLPFMISATTSPRTCYTFETKQQAEAELPEIMKPIHAPAQWFLKGSRFHALETLIPVLQSHLGTKVIL
jgi:UDP-N-acetylmuramoyl-tripeptide--D-alanyl-D-alanine ligase